MRVSISGGTLYTEVDGSTTGPREEHLYFATDGRIEGFGGYVFRYGMLLKYVRSSRTQRGGVYPLNTFRNNN